MTAKQDMDNALNGKLMEIEELMNLLGYKEVRSAKNWCSKNNIPIVRLGKKRYVDSSFINNLVSQSLRQDNATDYGRGHRAPMENTFTCPSTGSNEIKHGKAAQKFLSKFKPE